MYKLTSENDRNRFDPIRSSEWGGNPFVGRDARVVGGGFSLRPSSRKRVERRRCLTRSIRRSCRYVLLRERERGWFVLFFAHSPSPSLEVGSFSVFDPRD